MAMIAIVLGCVSTAINLMMAALSLYFSRAAGWRHYRTFSWVCLLLSAYTLNDLLFLHFNLDASVREHGGRIKLFLAPISAYSLLVFNRQQAAQAKRKFDNWIVVLLVPFACAALVPGVGVDGYDLVSIPSMGLLYLIPKLTVIGIITVGVAVACMLVTAFRYFCTAVMGNRADWMNAIGFAVLVLFAFEEAMVVLGILDWPYLLPLAFASLILLVLVDISSTVSRNSTALAELNEDLKRRVQRFSEELANTQEELFVAERQVALEQLAAGIGHEINNPLTSVGGNLEFIQGRFDSCDGLEDEKEAVADALEGVERIHGIVSDLTLSGVSSGRGSEFANPMRAIEVALRLLDPRYRTKIEFSVDVCCDSWAAISESKLTQVLLNLLTNAAYSVDEAGRNEDSPVVVRARVEQSGVIIDIIDKGLGVDQDMIHRIFDPLFTTKEVGEGTGLGLYVSRSIVESVGGSLILVKSDEMGSTMRIRLRAAMSGAKSGLAVREPARGRSEFADLSGLRVCLIDDEVRVARAIQRMCKEHDVSIENDSRAALKKLQGGAQYDVILCDLMMPELTGMELYRRVIVTRPELSTRFVFITGGAVTSDAQDFVESSSIRVLTKPLRRATLQQHLGQVYLST